MSLLKPCACSYEKPNLSIMYCTPSGISFCRASLSVPGPFACLSMFDHLPMWLRRRINSLFDYGDCRRNVNLARCRAVSVGHSLPRVPKPLRMSQCIHESFEKGQSMPGAPANPSLRSIMALAQVLGVNLDELVPQPWPDLRAGTPQ